MRTGRARVEEGPNGPGGVDLEEPSEEGEVATLSATLDEIDIEAIGQTIGGDQGRGGGEGEGGRGR